MKLFRLQGQRVAHCDSRHSGRGGPGAEPRAELPTESSNQAEQPLTGTTAQLVEMLHRRLEMIRANGDVQIREIANQLEEHLAEIRRELSQADKPDKDAG